MAQAKGRSPVGAPHQHVPAALRQRGARTAAPAQDPAGEHQLVDLVACQAQANSWRAPPSWCWPAAAVARGAPAVAVSFVGDQQLAEPGAGASWTVSFR